MDGQLNPVAKHKYTYKIVKFFISTFPKTEKSYGKIRSVVVANAKKTHSKTYICQ